MRLQLFYSWRCKINVLRNILFYLFSQDKAELLSANSKCCCLRPWNSASKVWLLSMRCLKTNIVRQLKTNELKNAGRSTDKAERFLKVDILFFFTFFHQTKLSYVQLIPDSGVGGLHIRLAKLTYIDLTPNFVQGGLCTQLSKLY